MKNAIIFLALLASNGVYGQDKNDENLTTSRYQANADGTVKDLETGLLWMRCAIGQEWNGSTCLGKAQRFNWQDASKIRKDFAGYNDWRLPSIEELRTLVYCSNGKPAYFNNGKPGLNEYAAQKSPEDFDWGCEGKPEKEHNNPTIVQNVFPKTPSSYFWSSSPSKSNNMWSVGFIHGNDYDYSENDHYVRLAHKAQ